MDTRKIEFVLVILCFVILMFLFFENSITGFSVFEKSVSYAPHDFIDKRNIEVYEDKIILNIKNYSVSEYSFSESMMPTFGNEANGVGIKPNSEEDIHVGDIIIFRKDEGLIVHRVIEMGVDEFGNFFVTKGDNNNFADGKVRFEEIESVIVAIIY